MANPEHVKILRQGVELWNQWRKENSKIKPDLSRTNLSGTNLNGADLSNAKLMKVYLNIANLTNANLRNANLTNANLREAVLSSANLTGANLSGIYLREAVLISAKLMKANLSGTNLTGADLSNADLRGAVLSNAGLSEANLTGANLTGANLTGANLTGANLSRANLSRANLRWVNLSSANLRWGILIGSDLRNVSFNSADFSSSDLTGSYLYLSLRDYWEINGVKCDYIYWDREGKERTPKDRDFLPGEFEELYKWQPINNFEKMIRCSIEFPAEYKQAGISILNYFSEILHKKYPEATATVDIKQDGLKVTMIVDPVDGKREIIEKMLHEYGLVVTGKMTPEAFTDDRFAESTDFCKSADRKSGPDASVPE